MCDVTDEKQARDEPFVEFGPEQARKAKQNAHRPDPPIPIPADIHPIVRIVLRTWRFVTRGTEDDRKLWSRRTP